MSDLVAVRSTLMQPFAAAAGDLVGAILYQAAPQDLLPDGDPVVRVEMAAPQRLLFGAGGDRVIEHEGSLVLSWLFPPQTGSAAVAAAIETTVAIYREQTLAGGVRIRGDATANRRGVDPTGRIRWDVVVPWSTVESETTFAGTPTLGALPTLSAALATVRSVWLQEIEQPSAGWSGLRTFYDDVVTLHAPPPTPWCGYWVSPSAFGSDEVQGVQTVLGRGLVQLHTDPSLGQAPPLAICDRIVSRHNRVVGGVQFGVAQVEAQQVSPAGTFQTNLRIPFSLQRVRPS